jgi:hypothetical protein
MPEGKIRFVAKLSGYALAIILLLAFTGVATFAVLGDNSIHGLTVRFYNVSWSCASGNTGPLTFTFGSIVVYSSTSLPTSLSHVMFSMSTNGFTVGSLIAESSSFGPGQSSSYPGLTFTNPALDPASQPDMSLIALTVNAQVSAGFYTSEASASYSQTVHFPSQACST